MNIADGKKDLMVVAGMYSLYFGAMGVMLPYFNLYCYRLGLSGAEIGTISATRSLVFIISTILWGIIADRFGIRRKVFLLCSCASALIWSLFLHYDTFVSIILVTILYSIFYSPIISFLETFTMQILGDKNNNSSPVDYGKIRAWGSLSFILIALAAGWLIDLTSAWIVIPMILGISLIRVLLSFQIPDAEPPKSTSMKKAGELLADKKVIIFLFSAFLMLASHGAYYGFFSIHLENMGFPGRFIGITWGAAIVCEIIVMLKSEAIFKGFSYEKVLVFSFFIAALRWFGLYFAESAISILLLQTLHAVTYGTFHMASVLYIDQLSPSTSKTIGQAVNNAISYGLGLMFGIFVCGLFFEKLGPVLFLGSSLTAFIGGAVFMLNIKLGQKELTKQV